MKTYRSLLVSFAVLSLTITSFDVFAQSLPPNMQALIQACGADVKSFCPGIMPGSGRIARCLQANIQNISASCHTAIGASLKTACGPDIDRLCGGAVPGSGIIEACLHEHSSELSGACKSLSDRFAVK
jgi:hypothetical protein